MTEIKRYDVNKANMIGLVRFDEKESGRWVKYEDLAAIQEQLSQFSMSAGHADQRKAESVAVRVALGFSADADDVAPCDLVDAIASLQEQVRALAAECSALKSAITIAKDEMQEHYDSDGVDSEDSEGKFMDACIRLCDAQSTINKIESTNTPATDAALREIRAQALESLADDGEHEWLESYLLELRNRAAAIREGDQP